MLQAPFTGFFFYGSGPAKRLVKRGVLGAKAMGDTEDDPKLKALEERLSQARQRAQGENADDRPSPMGRAFRMGIDLVAGVGVGLIIGINLDGWLDTSPGFLITFLFLGFAAGIRNVIREANKMQREAEDGLQGQADEADKD
ncbi:MULTISPECIES: AtpZ/AtpI family protein [Kordiimonas]|jgi:ATP synthase protein I|uniref:AtpZ/AtpI family protein n=1 Tax=Kordiimonas TaxID=288021 RepID=UPI00257DB977|nr:AtpZ/AtpI family protein [Kordiimonas sp. UBA4487]